MKPIINKIVLNECILKTCHNKTYKYYGDFLVCKMHYERFTEQEKKERKKGTFNSLVTKHQPIKKNRSN